MEVFNLNKQILSKGFIDIHCHCLFGVDDGPSKIEDSILLIKKAVSEGIVEIIATPHFHFGYNYCDINKIIKSFDVLQEELKKVIPEVKLYLGNEVYYSENMYEYLVNNNILTINSSKYFLVEFSPSHSYRYILNGITQLISLGYLPILAHVERYKCLIDDYPKLIQLSDIGVYFQVNTNSIINNKNQYIKKYIKRLFQDDLVSFVATDAHDIKYRAPNSKTCAHYISKKWGENVMKKCMIENPKMVISGEII